MPADIPLVSEGTIRTLLNMNEPLVFPSYHYRKGHPVSFSPDILPALLAYRGEQGLRGAFSNAQIEPAYLNTDDPFILMDMDTPEDYQNILHRKSEAL